MENPRKLYRSNKKWIADVYGGLVEYLNLDPTIIRVLWVILSLLYGIGVVAYIVAWIIVPTSPN